MKAKTIENTVGDLKNACVYAIEDMYKLCIDAAKGDKVLAGIVFEGLVLENQVSLHLQQHILPYLVSLAKKDKFESTQIQQDLMEFTTSYLAVRQFGDEHTLH